MDRTERFYRIDQLLQDRHPVPVSVFLDTLEVSLATFKRDLEYMRERFNAPIVWDREERGYRFDVAKEGPKYALPGLWLNASEIHALLTMEQLLKDMDPGVLAPHVAPLLARLRLLLSHEDVPPESVEKRIRLQRANARTYEPKWFSQVATAVLQRRRLQIEHYNRARDETLQREVSPQRLNYYRDTWYLDCWCHLRKGLRRFSLDAIRSVVATTAKAKDISERELSAVLESGYGVFSGANVDWAELQFTPERARWVQSEVWHRNQKSWIAADGSYYLRIPFSDARELTMDILRHMPEVRVIEPLSLRQRVRECLQAGLAMHSGENN